MFFMKTNASDNYPGHNIGNLRIISNPFDVFTIHSLENVKTIDSDWFVWLVRLPDLSEIPFPYSLCVHRSKNAIHTNILITMERGSLLDKQCSLFFREPIKVYENRIQYLFDEENYLHILKKHDAPLKEIAKTYFEIQRKRTTPEVDRKFKIAEEYGPFIASGVFGKQYSIQDDWPKTIHKMLNKQDIEKLQRYTLYTPIDIFRKCIIKRHVLSAKFKNRLDILSFFEKIKAPLVYVRPIRNRTSDLEDINSEISYDSPLTDLESCEEWKSDESSSLSEHSYIESD